MLTAAHAAKQVSSFANDSTVLCVIFSLFYDALSVTKTV